MATRDAGAQRFRPPAELAGKAPRGRRKHPPARQPRRHRRRYAVVYDIDGPLVRLGMLWFVVAAGSLAVGPLPAAVVYGGAAAIAAAQTARAWRRQEDAPESHPNELVAAGLAGGMVLGACLGAGGAGLALLAGVAVAVLVATADTASTNPTLTDAGWTIQCALLPGLAAMSVVLLTRLDQGSAIALLLLVSAYETGDYIVGSGAGNPFEGPVAGLAAVVVVTFIVSTLPISALDFTQSWVFGGIVAVLAPLGQLLASALLPAADSRASALRRLDSLLLTAPLWCFGVGLVL